MTRLVDVEILENCQLLVFIQLNNMLQQPAICELCGRKKIFRSVICPKGVCRNSWNYGLRSWPPFCPIHQILN